jgi:hypothetical protein
MTSGAKIGSFPKWIANLVPVLSKGLLLVACLDDFMILD